MRTKKPEKWVFKESATPFITLGKSLLKEEEGSSLALARSLGSEFQELVATVGRGEGKIKKGGIHKASSVVDWELKYQIPG